MNKGEKVKVNDLVKTIGYARNRLDHFEFYLFDPYNDDWITIKKATVDEYILLCDRDINEWMIEDNDKMSITIRMTLEDKENFKDHIL